MEEHKEKPWQSKEILSRSFTASKRSIKKIIYTLLNWGEEADPRPCHGKRRSFPCQSHAKWQMSEMEYIIIIIIIYSSNFN